MTFIGETSLMQDFVLLLLGSGPVQACNDQGTLAGRLSQG